MIRFVLPLLLAGCWRETSDYPVRLYGQGTALDEVLPAPEPMGGSVEWVRARLWGTNLGASWLGGVDQPRQDGADLVLGTASFGWPAATGFDRATALVRGGPPVPPNEDGCYTLVEPGALTANAESVDVGDHLAFTLPSGQVLRLERDPSAHPRPAGESWYVGYGGRLTATVGDHPNLPNTWESGAWSLGFPGSIAPPEATFGVIPRPVAGELRVPEPVADLQLDGRPVRAPHHGYDDDGVWVGEDVEDDVRFPSPFREQGLEITWTPAAEPAPLTLSLRLLASGVEGACDCTVGCGPGFTCETEPGAVTGDCVANEGSSWLVVGELVCTLADDGAFTLEPERLDHLQLWVPWDPEWVQGATLSAGRTVEGTLEVPDVLTANGRRVSITPVRTRASDVIVTRLEGP
jgi:hypothetical protein